MKSLGRDKATRALVLSVAVGAIGRTRPLRCPADQPTAADSVRPVAEAQRQTESTCLYDFLPFPARSRRGRELPSALICTSTHSVLRRARRKGAKTKRNPLHPNCPHLDTKIIRCQEKNQKKIKLKRPGGKMLKLGNDPVVGGRTERRVSAKAASVLGRP
jgi:hypothetical protein